MKVQINNFQILKDAVFSFQPGINLIVGPSNNGKSASLRAIEAALFNKAGNSFITQGQKQTKVSIHFDDKENPIVWTKDTAGASYLIDNQPYTKLGRGSHVDAENFTNIRETRVLDNVEKLNFWKQMEFPFLLNETPSRLYSFLSKSSQKDDLTVVLKEMTDDTKELEKEEKRLNTVRDTYKMDLVSVDEEIAKYKNIADLQAQSLEIEKELDKYNSLLDLIVNTKAAEMFIEEKTNRLSKIKAHYDTISELVDSISLDRKSLAELATLARTINNLDVSRNDSQQLLNNSKDSLTKIEQVFDRASVLYSEILDDRNTQHEYIRLIGIAQSSVVRLSNKQDELEDKKTAFNILSTVNETREEYDSYISLVALISSLDVARKALDNTTVIDGLKDRLNQVETELASIDVCPLCKSHLGKCEEK